MALLVPIATKLKGEAGPFKKLLFEGGGPSISYFINWVLRHKVLLYLISYEDQIKKNVSMRRANFYSKYRVKKINSLHTN